MIWIYSDKVTARLIHTLDFIFKQRGISVHLTNDKSQFLEQKDQIRFAYSKDNFGEISTIHPSNLLFEENIQLVDLKKENWLTSDCLKFNGVVDPIASVFYILSRYEEYLPFKADEHGRFTAKESILIQFDWLKIPICDVWSEAIIDWISKKNNHEITIKRGDFNFIPTFDIDNSYAFLLKSSVQLWGGKVKDVLQSNAMRMGMRESVLSGDEKDPFDTYNEIIKLKQEDVHPYIFWHLGDLKKYDRNISWTNEAHQRLIQRMSTFFPVGIHPSYFSNSKPEKVGEERGRLEYIIGKPVYASRQHFLKISFPNTFQQLVKMGMKHEFSMGFSDEVGFRMGTARAFPFFDLVQNHPTELMLHPFVYMDGTLNQYKNYTPEEAKKIIKDLLLQVKQFGGDFICIWHNETIGESGIWKDWKAVFDYNLTTYKQLVSEHGI